MTSKEVREMLRNPNKRTWLVHFLDQVEGTLSNLLRDTRKWKEAANDNAALEKDLKRMSPDDRRKAIAKMMKDGIQMNKELTAYLEPIEKEMDIGEAHHVNDFMKDLRKIEKRGRKYQDRSDYDIHQLITLVNTIGIENAVAVTNAVEGKTLRHKGASFSIQRYTYRLGNPFIQLEGFDRLLLLHLDKILPELDKRADAIKSGVTTKNDTTAGGIIDFIKHRSKEVGENEVLAGLMELRIKVQQHAARVDGLHLQAGMLHLRGHPHYVWVPINTKAIEEAVRLLSYVPALDAKLEPGKGKEKSFIPDLDHAVQGIDQNGKPLTKHMYEQLKTYGFTKDEIAALEGMHEHLKHHVYHTMQKAA
ncbi:MAG: hypothetical protein ACE5DM_02870 [Candidatus Nanoarchaeia archaeon]